ncbi:MAG: sigma-70 family RNA polymerase sigma factor [Bacilli bacterium]|nr:sigma-70 family RNA polymerase sigma factor [Bacilli bacterium]
MEDIVILDDEILESTFSDDAFKLYMQEIKQYPLLSKEETINLFKKYQNGDLRAKERLINCNLRLVVTVASRYKNYINHLQILDIIQEGNLGLIRALETYDPELGAFSTYAFPWIRQKITRGMSNTEATIRKPVHMENLIRQFKRLVDKYKGGRELSDLEIMRALKIDKDTLNLIYETLNNSVVSINQKVGDEEDSELGDLIPSTNDSGYTQVLDKMDSYDLFCVLKEILNDREYYVLYNRVLMEEILTLEQLGEKLNLTRERVRQIEAKALKKARPVMERPKYKGQILSKVKEKYGVKYNYLNIKPKDIDAIIEFMYVRDELLDIEISIYYDMTISEFKYDKKMIAYKHGITEKNLDNYEKSIRDKIQYKMRNKKAYKLFYYEMVKLYGSNIFNVNLLEGLNMIDYSLVTDKYINLSLDEIKKSFGNLYDELTIDEQKLLERYFVVPERKFYGRYTIERDVNLTIFGFKNTRQHVNKDKLYKVYLDNKKYFNEEQRLYLECVYFNQGDRKLFKSKYPNSNLLKDDGYIIERLEKIYFKIFRLLDNSFDKERYLEVKNKYREKLSEDRIKLLDLFYGVDGEEVKIIEMAEMFNMDYNKIHDLVRDAREYAISLYYNRTNTLDIDKSIYHKYIFDYSYDFTNETRSILKMFIVDGMSYGQINEVTNLGNYRISNIVTDAIRKMDLYRFNIIRPKAMNRELFEKFMSSYINSLKDPVYLEVWRDKFFNGLDDNKELCKKYNLDNKTLNETTARFYKLFFNYQVADIEITKEDLLREINKSKGISLLSDEQKAFAVDYIGISTEALSEEALRKKYNLDRKKYIKLIDDVTYILKGSKIGEVYNDYDIIPKDVLNKLFKDSHLPISDKERHIIGSILELDGYTYLSEADLAEYYGERKANMKRRFQRGILNIFKYLNGEIEGIIDYETDVLPYLKYFSKSDKLFLTEYYLNGLTYEEIGKKYNLTFNMVVILYNRLLNNLFEMQKNPNAKKFDFDYYNQVFMNDDVPYYGDKELAMKVFGMYFGDNIPNRMSLPKIAQELKLDYSESTFIHLIDEVMLSVCRYKEGIKKLVTFNYDEIKEYYLKNKDSLGWKEQYYLSYFDRCDNGSNRVNGNIYFINYPIIFDMIQEKYDNYFNLDKVDREYVIDVLRKYGHNILKRVRNELMFMFDISGRSFMSGKEINHVYRVLYGLDVKKKKMQKDNSFVLKSSSYE